MFDIKLYTRTFPHTLTHFCYVFVQMLYKDKMHKIVKFSGNFCHSILAEKFVPRAGNTSFDSWWSEAGSWSVESWEAGPAGIPRHSPLPTAAL
jgi:nitroreductase